jgi:N-glycosylase/DNA lyase
MTKSWTVLCSASKLNLQKTLYSGQAFRWVYEDGIHKCVLTVGQHWYAKGKIMSPTTHHLVWLQKQDKEICYTSIPTIPHEYLEHYFSLDVDMDQLYSQWAKDDWFKSIVGEDGYGGLRMIRGDVVEVVCSFLCSQNNNLKRITSMVMKLCSGYGKPIQEVSVDAKMLEDKEMYTVPEFEDLIGDLDGRLREWGFGYRAKYFLGTRDLLLEKNSFDSSRSYLASIAELETKKARAELLELPGIGRKVADCILLFGMNKVEIVPMDTHIKQIVESRYSWMLKAKANQKGVAKTKANETMHELIQDGFEKVFGQRAGWAHSVLFWYQLGNHSMFTSKGWVPFE